jgi:beta-ureidopropionase / N-carbamoyl-L-amino-acid hydrolase
MVDPPIKINADRLNAHLDELSQIGALAGGGVTRLALTDEDKRARDRLVSWMTELEMKVQLDRVGNIVGIRPGLSDHPPVMLGSHIDTVISAGRFDGCYGVLAALECVRVLNEKKRKTLRPIAVTAFTNEEGVRYQPGMLGSAVYSGSLSVDKAMGIAGIDGSVFGEELERIGYSGPKEPGWIKPSVYLELHIEQGPVLDLEEFALGVVEGVVGISWWELNIDGSANHAGTTPIQMRRDAGLAAAKLVMKVREIALSVGGNQRATCGMLKLFPGAINVIPGKAVLFVDLRNNDEEGLLKAEMQLIKVSKEIEREEGVTILVRQLEKVSAVQFDEGVVSTLEKVSESMGIRFKRMISGAGHDAQLMAHFCPAAMIFVPSRGGISHSQEEFSSPEALAVGGNVLLNALQTFANVRLD